MSRSHDDLTLAPVSESNLGRLSEVLSHAFGFPQDDARPWFERAGLENVRVLSRGAHVCGGLIEIPMGQWFGGRSVPMMGVAGVAVIPEERGQKVATHLMIAMLRQARARGFALSTLYPATVTLYRRAGYERAGVRCSVSFDPRTFEVPRAPEMTIRETQGVPDDAVALYRATASRISGYLDRGPYIWSRIAKPRGASTKTFTVSHGGTFEGYVVLSHVMASDASSVNVTDLAATTGRAAQAILRLLAEYRSLAVRVKWHGGPSDVFTHLLPERVTEIAVGEQFMVRVVDVVAALGQRGWPRGASGALILEVDDASLSENSGRYELTLQEGVGKVVPVSSVDGPRAKITERGLAALYTGYVTADVAAAAGWLEADEDVRAQLDAWFGGPMPVTRDFF